MGTISSSVGLFSGLPIGDIVDQLIAIERRPVDVLEARNEARRAQQAAFQSLAAKLLTLKLSATRFGEADIFQATKAASSQPSLVRPTSGPRTPLGGLAVRPLALAQTHQLLSNGLAASSNDLLPAGTLRIAPGGFVDPQTPLEFLNGGAGVRRGLLKITDRTGASAVVDLSAVRTVQDAVAAINNQPGIAVQASLSDRRIVLEDLSGQTISDLRVEEVSGGRVAADLGILGNSTTNTLTGNDILTLGDGYHLAALNGGSGVGTVAVLDDLRIKLTNDEVIDVNLESARTLGDVIAAINNDSDNAGRLTASFSSDGLRLVLTDNTGGGGAGVFSVQGINGSLAARDLGIEASVTGATITGRRLLDGLDGVLLSRLRGGKGITELGSVQLTDRSGATATVDLSAQETLAGVVAQINAAGLGITARVNDARNGIVLSDTTGASASNLIVADVATGTAAADLNIAADVAASSIQSGDLQLQYVRETTSLSVYRGGLGVRLGKFQITDSAGAAATIDLTAGATTRVQDVIDKINIAGIGVHAALNERGDGIVVEDTAGGAGTLTIADLAGSAANDLRLAGSGDGRIDGSLLATITLDGTTTLAALVQKINDAGAPVRASILNDGSSAAPLRLALTSTRSGLAGELLIDTSALPFSFGTLSPARDAVLEIGGAGGLVLTSGSNTFSDVLPDLKLEIDGTSATPVTVTVTRDLEEIVAAVKNFVDGFNGVTKAIGQLTKFNPESTERGVLQGDGLVLRLESALRALVGTPGSSAPAGGTGVSPVTLLAQLGVRFANGALQLDESVLRDRIAADAQAVGDFFLAPDTGMADRLETLIQRYTNAADGALTARSRTIDESIRRTLRRIDELDLILERRREALLRQFLQMESALAQFQSQQTALERLQVLAPLTPRRG